MSSSQELEWELGDIFDGGIFVFPVDEPGVARAVVRYLLMRGILAEEVADAIEQPGSKADLVAWLGGDERKSMIGVWATAWLNDARRRHDTDRRREQRRRRAVPTAPEYDPDDGHVDGDDAGRRSPSPARGRYRWTATSEAVRIRCPSSVAEVARAASRAIGRRSRRLTTMTVVTTKTTTR